MQNTEIPRMDLKESHDVKMHRWEHLGFEEIESRCTSGR